MEVYFNLLPEELNYVIFSYLNYEESVEIEEIIPINYEKLLGINYPEDYKDIKEIFNIDDTIRKYKNNKWDILYKDIITRRKHNSPFDIDFILFNSISNNIDNTIFIYKKYNEFFKFNKIL